MSTTLNTQSFVNSLGRLVGFTCEDNQLLHPKPLITDDILKEDERIHLLAKRGKAVKQRRWKPDVQKKITSKRQIVETAFSCITNLLPRAIIVRTQQGFRVSVIPRIKHRVFTLDQARAITNVK